MVDGKVAEIYRTILEYPGASGSSTRTSKTVALIEFCEEKIRRTWYSKTIELSLILGRWPSCNLQWVSREIAWEEYRITLEVASGQTERERNKIDAVTKVHLSSFLMALIAFADTHKSHT